MVKCYEYTALLETMDGKFLPSAEQELEELFSFYSKEIIKGESLKKNGFSLFSKRISCIKLNLIHNKNKIIFFSIKDK